MFQSKINCHQLVIQLFKKQADMYGIVHHHVLCLCDPIASVVYSKFKAQRDEFYQVGILVF
jgi:hypothetical protein